MSDSGSEFCLFCDSDRRRVAIDASLLEHVGKTTMAHVQTVVGHQFGVSREDLRSPYRDAHLSWARHVAMFVARSETNASLPAIGSAFGNRGHTTVLHGIRRVGERAANDDEARREVVDALTTLWLAEVASRVERAERSATSVSDGWPSSKLERRWPTGGATTELETSSLARTIVRERYSEALEASEADETYVPRRSAGWQRAVTIWLVCLESSASPAAIAAALGHVDDVAIAEAARRVTHHGAENPLIRDELFALVEALRWRRSPSGHRPASGLPKTAPVLTPDCDPRLNLVYLSHVDDPSTAARRIPAAVCRYLDASPAAIRSDESEEMQWARDLIVLLVHGSLGRNQADTVVAQQELDEAARRVRARLLHDGSARQQVLAILADLRAEDLDR